MGAADQTEVVKFVNTATVSAVAGNVAEMRISKKADQLTAVGEVDGSETVLAQAHAALYDGVVNRIKLMSEIDSEAAAPQHGNILLTVHWVDKDLAVRTEGEAGNETVHLSIKEAASVS